MPGPASDSLLHARLFNSELASQSISSLSSRITSPALSYDLRRQFSRVVRFALPPVPTPVNRHSPGQPCPVSTGNELTDTSLGHPEFRGQRSLRLTCRVPLTNLCNDRSRELRERMLLPSVVGTVAHPVHCVLGRCPPAEIHQPVILRATCTVQNLMTRRAGFPERFQHEPTHQVSLTRAVRTEQRNRPTLMTGETGLQYPAAQQPLSLPNPYITVKTSHSAKIRHFIETFVTRYREPPLLRFIHDSYAIRLEVMHHAR